MDLGGFFFSFYSWIMNNTEYRSQNPVSRIQNENDNILVTTQVVRFTVGCWLWWQEFPPATFFALHRQEETPDGTAIEFRIQKIASRIFIYYEDLIAEFAKKDTKTAKVFPSMSFEVTLPPFWLKKPESLSFWLLDSGFRILAPDFCILSI